MVINAHLGCGDPVTDCFKIRGFSDGCAWGYFSYGGWGSCGAFCVLVLMAVERWLASGAPCWCCSLYWIWVGLRPYKVYIHLYNVSS